VLISKGRIRFAALVFATIAGTSAGTSAIAQISLRDDRGATLTLPAPPQRIVSLLPSITESICALDACARLVGTDRYSNWPASVAALPKLGGIDDAQIEGIVALHPDVVLLSTSSRVTERLEALGLKVLVIESRDHADMKRTLALLARMLDARPRADEVLARIDRETKTAADRVPAELRGKRVYFEVDSTPYAAGVASFIGETLSQLGMANAVPAELGPFPKLNPEYVVRLRPDIVMAAARSIADMPQRPGWDALGAIRDRQICSFTPDQDDLLVRPGPRMGEAALVLSDCLVAMRHAKK
jgi:iron complex transport system substrate-binding protein